MKPIDSPVFKAFHSYQYAAMEIAGECDKLLEEQREVAFFADQLRFFLADLRKIVGSALPTESGHTITITAAEFSKMTDELAKMESAVGKGKQDATPVSAQRSQGQGLSLLARKTN
ncbi:MAG: hypothetical protein WCP20_17550 [Desulfuromonadales bacterium]